MQTTVQLQLPTAITGRRKKIQRSPPNTFKTRLTATTTRHTLHLHHNSGLRGHADVGYFTSTAKNSLLQLIAFCSTQEKPSNKERYATKEKDSSGVSDSRQYAQSKSKHDTYLVHNPQWAMLWVWFGLACQSQNNTPIAIFENEWEYPTQNQTI
jgi:hypothetical protein